MVAAPAFAADPPAASSATAAGQPSEAEMMKQMMELSKLNENHKLLGQLVGDWDVVTKMWMAPSAPVSESKGTATRRAIMDGRFYTADYRSTMKMPDEHGKLSDFAFQGTSLEGYDNVKKKFFSTWCDNMGTGVMLSEGTYDPASKTFTYTAEMEVMPGMKSKVREAIKIVDANHHTFEFFENRGGKEEKTMEINYTRK
jgi:Protein of unknown function (DUF1579)